MLPQIIHCFERQSIIIMLFMSVSTIFVIFLQCCSCKKKNKLLDDSRGVADPHDPTYATLHKLKQSEVFPLRKTDKTININDHKKDDGKKLKPGTLLGPYKNHQKQRQLPEGNKRLPKKRVSPPSRLPKTLDFAREVTDDYAELEIDRVYIAKDGPTNPMPKKVDQLASQIYRNKIAIADDHSAFEIQQYEGGHKFSENEDTYQTLEEGKISGKKQR